MISKAYGLRHKAYIAVSYEGGFRPSEMLTLHTRNIEFDSYGAVIKVRGKTGERWVRILESAVRLLTWIENHIDPVLSTVTMIVFD